MSTERGTINKKKWGKCERLLPQKPPLPFQQGLIWKNQVSGPLGTGVGFPTWLLPVSHGGCAGTGPTHDTLQPQFIHICREGERDMFARQVKQVKRPRKLHHCVANSRRRFICHLQKKGVNIFEMVQFLAGKK